MLTKSLIKKLEEFMKIEKLGNNQYVGKYNGQIISWFDQSGNAICIKLRYLNDHDDMQSDYSAGAFYDTIASIVKSLKSGK